jgi:hypothetical protein
MMLPLYHQPVLVRGRGFATLRRRTDQVREIPI